MTEQQDPSRTELRLRTDRRVWVKVCGFTEPGPAVLAAEQGTDAVGVVLHEASPRHVTSRAARDVSRAVREVSGQVLVVGVAVDLSADELLRSVDDAELTGLQLHGRDAGAAIPAIRRERPDLFLVRAVRRPPDEAWGRLTADGADALLVDAQVPGLHGGTGVRLRWQRPDADAPVILAGGLTPGNVAEAVATVQPFGVDVSSGVEVSPGVKDPALVEAFLAATARAVRSRT